MLYRFNRYVALPFWLGMVVFLSLTVWISWYINARNLELTEAVSEDVESVKNAQELVLGIREIRTELGRFLVSRDPKYLDNVPALDDQVRQWIGKVQASGEPSENQSLFARLVDGYTQFERDFATARELTEEDRWHAINALRENVFKGGLTDDSRLYLQQKQDLVRATVKDNELFADRLIVVLVVLSCLAAGAGASIGYLSSLSMQRIVVQLNLPISDAVGKLGEVVGPVTVRAPKTLAEIRGNLNQVAEQVRVVVERLQQSQRETLRAEQLAAVGQMAAGMAHELRNPLTSIKILIQAANERRALGPRDLLVFEQEISRLEGLIQSFLEFARPPQPDKHRIDVRQVVQDAMHLFSPRCERSGIQLESVLPEEPVWCQADGTQIHQVLLNLLVNALEASSRGGHIWVELLRSSAEDSQGKLATAVLKVSDDGCGLPMGLGDRVFEPFMSTKQTGIGMGLSICRRIVEAHAGTITASPRAPNGTVFTVALPSVDVAHLAPVS